MTNLMLLIKTYLKMFTWRIAQNSLALRTNLVRRGVPSEDCKCYSAAVLMRMVHTSL
jgi:hypothetical protein